jgi:hypothetical protein
MCMSIGESERHNQIFVQPVPAREGSLRNIFRTDLDLMVTRMEIDLRKNFSTGQLIKENVDAGNRYLFLTVTAFKSR